MTYDPNRHNDPFDKVQGRRSIRLKGYDYSRAGAYFVTICTHQRQCLFGDIVDGDMRLNALGEIARQCWLAIPDHFPHARLDEFVIMPNHVHGIIWIVDDVRADAANVVGAKNFSPLQNQYPHGTSKTIGSIVRGFKIGVTKWARQHANVHTVWQRNYYEHIIRDEKSLNRIRQYIMSNPMRWHLDRENPAASGDDPEWELWG